MAPACAAARPTPRNTRFETKKVLPFFPTFVWSHQLAEAEYSTLNAAFRAKIDALVAAAPDTTAPGGGDSITFFDPRPQIHMISPDVRRVNDANSDHVALEVKEGMLVMFPAWLVHSVPDNAADELRISIAFTSCSRRSASA